MATRRDANQSGKRRRPASQGHPSRGSKTSQGTQYYHTPVIHTTPKAPIAPSRQVHQAQSKRRAAVRSQRKFARTVRSAAGLSSPLGEFERQSSRYSARHAKALEHLAHRQYLRQQERSQAPKGPQLPRNREVALPEPESGPLRHVERSYLTHAKPEAGLAYLQRRHGAEAPERKANKALKAYQPSGKNLLDQALLHGAATLAGIATNTPAATHAADDALRKSPLKLSRVPSALYHGVTEHRASDVDEPNAVEIAEGAVGGLIESAVHPKKAVKAMADDLEKRYGRYLTGKQTTKQYKKQVSHTPRLPYIADAASLIPAGGTAGALAGRVTARAVAKAALAHGAKDAARKAERVANYLDPKVARPHLAARDGRTVPQRTPTTGGFRLTAQREIDRLRGSATARRAGRSHPSQSARVALEHDAVQPITAYGRGRAARIAARGEYGRWRARLHALNSRFGTKPLRRVRRLVGRKNMEDATLALGMMTGHTTPMELKAAARIAIHDLFEEGRHLKADDPQRVHLHDNIADLERLIAKPDEHFPDPAAMDEALKIVRANNEGLKDLDYRLDEGVRVHELEPARRLAGVEGPRATQLDEPAIKAVARNERKKAKREGQKLRKEYLAAQKRLDSMERRATTPQEHETLTGRTEMTYPGGTVRDAPKGWRVEGVGRDARWVNKANPRQRRIPDHTKYLNKEIKKQQRKVDKLKQQYLEKRSYLTESRARPAQEYFHGTTPEGAAGIQSEGFRRGPAGAIWGGTRDLAEKYPNQAAEREVVPAYFSPKRPIRSDSEEYIDIVAPAGSMEERNQLLRDAGYDAIEVPTKSGGTEIRAIAALDDNIVSPTAPVRPDMEEAQKTAYLQNVSRETAPGELPHSPVDVHPNVRKARYTERELRKKGFNPDNISYYHASRADSPERAAMAPGQGTHAPREHPETTYDLLATGRMDLNARRVLPEQIARNIKGTVAKDLIEEIIDKWTPEHITTRHDVKMNTRAISYQERQTIMNKAPEVADEYVWWNPGIASGASKLREHPDTLEGMADDFAVNFQKDWADSLDPKAEHGNDGPWYLLNKSRAEQMDQSLKFNAGLAARMRRKVLKGLPSKLVLMASPSWAILQVVNNAGLAGLAGMVNPFQYGKAVKVMREMKKEFPDEYERLMGAGAQGMIEHEFERTRLGSAGDKLYRDHPIIGRPMAFFRQAFDDWHGAIERAPAPIRYTAKGGEQLISFRALFHGDAAQNAFFRRTFMMDEAKRIKTMGMERAMNQEAGAIQRIMRNFNGETVTPEDLAKIVNDPAQLEHMARSTNELFGNYTDFSPMERRYLENNLMFYGFIRFSLRFTLYTMPVQHPLTTALLLKLSALKNEEVRNLLKTGPNDPLPFGAIGALYKISGNKITGQLPTNRINPFMNPVLSSLGGNAPTTQLLTSVSPLVTELFQQATGVNLFTGKTWYLKGPHESERLTGPADPRMPGYHDPDSLEARGRIALSHMLQLATPGRVASTQAAGGQPVAETSLPWDVQPIHFKEADTVSSIKKRAKQQPGAAEGYLRGLLDPVYSATTGDWAPSYNKEVAKYLKEQEERYVRPPKPKRRKGGGWSGGGW